MLIKTHLVISLFAILVLLPFVNSKIVFIVVALLATYIPDIDAPESKFGSKFYFRPLQWFVKHRGFLHSFSFLFLVSLIFVLFIPQLALGFFLGYGLHILLDSFTIQGVQIFYPFKRRISGKIRTGSLLETGFFVVFLVLDLVLTIYTFKSIF